MILSIAYFQIPVTIFFTIFEKPGKKNEKGLQVDSNSLSASYKANALTIGPQSSYTRRDKIY